MEQQKDALNQPMMNQNAGWYQAVLNSIMDAVFLLNDAGFIISSNPVAERMFGYPAAETDGQSIGLVIPDLRQQNKPEAFYVTVGKAWGSTIQLTYDRPLRKWRRRDNIALKHENEISVQPFTGEKMTGAGHAPMLYDKDPRTDLPSTLQKKVEESITGSDEIIVAGWVEN